MSPEADRCKVCGRTLEELEGEDPLSQHQEVQKCDRCINEYEAGRDMRKREQSDRGLRRESGWKEKIVA